MQQSLTFSYKTTAQLEFAQLEAVAVKHTLGSAIETLQKARQQQYATPYASINLVDDEYNLATIETLVVKKQALQPTVLIVIGIGGSCLGAKAVDQALRGSFAHLNNGLRVYYAQTVDADYTAGLIHIMEQEFQKGNCVLLNVVTKSGTTTETIANFQVLLAVLQQQFPTTYQDYVVVTTDKDSVLYSIAQQERFAVLEIPKQVGGRFSVFSAVGLFPLMMLSVDTTALLQGAADMLQQCLQTDLHTNPAALSALINFMHYRNGYALHDLFLFSVDLEGLGQWNRQLLAESLGKEHDSNGKQIFTGITPTVSIGTADLHSVAQLYLGGPRDKFTTFITVENNQHESIVPLLPRFQNQFSHLQQKSFATLMHATVEGTKKAYQNNQLPFCSLIFPQKNAYYLGQFMQMKLVETIYLAHLMQVNPFDQPHVELYKQETHKLLR